MPPLPKETPVCGNNNCPVKGVDFDSILTEDDFERIANDAASRAVAKMKDEFFKEIGKSFFSKFTVIVGIVVVGVAYKLQILLYWFGGK
jgi:hypothetical protein